MKVVILAGGLGSRLGEETALRPKPLVEIGGLPILWHIMKYYSSFGCQEFIICLGYKGFKIKEFFLNYMAHLSDLSMDFTENSIIYSYDSHKKEPWKLHLVHTGDNNMTGSRIYQTKKFFRDREDFCLTYGDGVCDVDIAQEIEFHKKHGKIGTILAVRPPGRFGVLSVEDSAVTSFSEKTDNEKGFINGGFFIFNTDIFNYLSSNEDLIFEQEPLQNLAQDGQLKAFQHKGFWQCMDTLRDKIYLEELWQTKNAPWKRW